MGERHVVDGLLPALPVVAGNVAIDLYVSLGNAEADDADVGAGRSCQGR